MAVILSIPLSLLLSAAAGPAPVPAVLNADESGPSYVLKGDLAEITAKGSVRFLVRRSPDYLPRSGDPRLAELDLARAFAAKLGLRAVFVPAASLDEMIADVNEGRGDIVIGSLTITTDRSAHIAFSRPIRYVAEVVVMQAANTSVSKPEDLAGKEITVRPSSAYAETLVALGKKVPGIKVKAAAEEEDTFSLIQKVARGEEPATVADSDILDAALGFETGVHAAVTIADKDPIAWGLRKRNDNLKAALDAFLVEKTLSAHKEHVYLADLDEIKKRGVVRVLTRNASTCYFLYRGEELGFEYELAKEFAKELGVRLELTIAPSRDSLLEWLKEGKGDLVAAGLSITAERQASFLFSEPYNTVSELLVVAAKDKHTKSLEDLKGKRVSVRKSSSYYESLLPLKEKYGFDIDLLPEDTETETALRLVAEGKLTATVADSNIVELELTYTDDIRSVGPLGEPSKIAWVMRKDQPQLKATADAFHKKLYHGVFYNMTMTKYFKNSKMMRASAGDERSDKAGQLSPYDALVKKYAKEYEFDWRLVTSQMYQESHFDSAAKSWVGALGLMQVMPATAQELKIDNIVEPENGIHAGVKLLARYAKLFSSPSVKEKDRIRFAIAAYNCGPGHVIDGRRLAADLKLNPDKWFGNVEKAMLLLSKPEYAKKARYGFCRCDEPVDYVSRIQSRYDSYSTLADLE
jgi:membrane-bound lytic murein transglycosylase F